MGLFSKTSKPNPRLTVAGIEVVFHRDHEGWEFSYRGVKFLSFLPALTLPSIAELDSILVTLESLKSEMRTRLRKGLSEWGDARLDDEESCSVNVQDHAADKSFTVSWSDGASWGDLGVAFIIRCSVIADESWGD